MTTIRRLLVVLTTTAGLAAVTASPALAGIPLNHCHPTSTTIL